MTYLNAFFFHKIISTLIKILFNFVANVLINNKSLDQEMACHRLGILLKTTQL